MLKGFSAEANHASRLRQLGVAPFLPEAMEAATTRTIAEAVSKTTRANDPYTKLQQERHLARAKTQGEENPTTLVNVVVPKGAMPGRSGSVGEEHWSSSERIGIGTDAHGRSTPKKQKASRLVETTWSG